MLSPVLILVHTILGDLQCIQTSILMFLLISRCFDCTSTIDQYHLTLENANIFP